jgi:hypothetical protein
MMELFGHVLAGVHDEHGAFLLVRERMGYGKGASGPVLRLAVQRGTSVNVETHTPSFKHAPSVDIGTCSTLHALLDAITNLKLPEIL